jgi:hypothetical protein
VLRVLAAGLGESYTKAASGVTGRVAYGPPGVTRDCTEKCTGLSRANCCNMSLTVPLRGAWVDLWSSLSVQETQGRCSIEGHLLIT